MTTALAAILALSPGVLVWAWGRRLVRSGEDPARPERVLAWGQRSIAAVAVLDRLSGPALWVMLGWPILLSVGALLRVVPHRAHEAASDRRAAELCGDPEALARALRRYTRSGGAAPSASRDGRP